MPIINPRSDILELIEAQILDKDSILKELLNWMSFADVNEFIDNSYSNEGFRELVNKHFGRTE